MTQFELSAPMIRPGRIIRSILSAVLTPLSVTLIGLGAAGLAGAPARAADAADNELRLGVYSIFYHTSADDLQGPYVPPGANLKADNVETVYFGYIRRLSAHFETELAIGWPPITKTEGKGPATLGSVPYDGQVISSARWLAPTLLFNYKFFDENSVLRPYIGVGVNYTDFYDRDSTAAGNAASGGPTKLSLPSSWGPAATAGVTYRLNDHWGLHASYGWAQVKTHLTADTDGTIRTTHISFAPQSFILSAGYAF
jgi:outer membrane protein